MTTHDWRAQFPDKVGTAAQAIALIRPGRRILIGSGAAEPGSLVQALVTHGGHLSDNEIVHLLTLGPAPYVERQLSHRFRHAAFFIGANVREAVQEGRADFIPVFLSEIPQLIRSRRVRIDVALIQTSPPDAHGFVSLGVSVDVVRSAVDSADLVLAEVNPRMPRTHGDSFLHVSKIDLLVPVDAPLHALAVDPPGEVEASIGRYVASLVADGATIQTGIGQIPDAVLAALSEHEHLGVHTEMLSDGVMKLAQRGVITGSRKSLLRGKMVTSFVMGSDALYAWAHENPALEMRGSEFTNDPQVIARNDDMVSVNSALAVDLTGQVAADTLLGKFFSGIGGQVDFVRGAARSRNGKSVIALPSTAKGGTVSRIRAAFEEGAGVVTSRGDVRYVVTEYGVADLWGRSVRERARALIEIAHPDFRGELLAQAKARRFVFADQQMPSAVYPWQEEREEALPGTTTRVKVRPVHMSDEGAVQRLFYELSEESTYKRFFGFRRVHSHEDMQKLVDSDYDLSMALVVCGPDSGEIIAMARYDVDPATKLGEIAFVVRDDWQRRGVGTLLMRRIAEIAHAKGLRGFSADVLVGNQGMLMVFHRSGLVVRSRLEGTSHHLEVLFEAEPVARPRPSQVPAPPPPNTNT
jgi:acyl-CoA hydrolase/N-acetylglutamate synthase-like GNAT family acetyltransferase